MVLLAIRSSSSDFGYAILTGTQNNPVLIKSDTIQFPKGYSHPDGIHWFKQEIEEISRPYEIEKWVIKGTEPMAMKGKAYVKRIEYEAMIQLCAAEKGNPNVIRKVKSTIAKDLGLPGKPKSLITDLDQTKFPELDGKPEKEWEAMIAGWSELE